VSTGKHGSSCFTGKNPYVVAEVNPQIVRRKKAMGEPIFYGDVSQPTVLNQLNITEARVMVIAIADLLEAVK